LIHLKISPGNGEEFNKLRGKVQTVKKNPEWLEEQPDIESFNLLKSQEQDPT